MTCRTMQLRFLKLGTVLTNAFKLCISVDLVDKTQFLHLSEYLLNFDLERHFFSTKNNKKKYSSKGFLRNVIEIEVCFVFSSRSTRYTPPTTHRGTAKAVYSANQGVLQDVPLSNPN